MQNCEFYKDETSCLECPFPDGYQPCMKSIESSGEWINVKTSKNTAKLIRCLAEYAGESFPNTVNRLISEGIKKVNPKILAEAKKAAKKTDSRFGLDLRKKSRKA